MAEKQHKKSSPAAELLSSFFIEEGYRVLTFEDKNNLICGPAKTKINAPAAKKPLSAKTNKPLSRHKKQK